MRSKETDAVKQSDTIIRNQGTDVVRDERVETRTALVRMRCFVYVIIDFSEGTDMAA